MSRALMTRSLGLLLLTLVATGCARYQHGVGLDSKGRAWAPLTAPTEVRVIVFTSVTCPIANGYVPELRRIVDHYRTHGVRFFMVYSDPTVTRTELDTHTYEYNPPGKLLRDRDQSLMRALGATITPEAFIIEPEPGHRSGYRVRYQGRIDDWYVDIGQRRFEPGQRDLREALDAVLAGEPVREPRTEAVGCAIPEG